MSDHSESSEDIDEYDDDYYKDSEDKKKLMALPEVEREAILFDRAEQRKEALERKETLQRVKARTGAS
eukprot:583-Heterococcus_DN1.PRE.1